MKKKKKIIFLLSSLVVLTTFNVFFYESWKVKYNMPYFREGKYKGEFVSKSLKKYELYITLKAITKKEYEESNGKNVIKDCALKRENDYYLVEGFFSVDDMTVELSFDQLKKRNQSSGGCIYYDKNDNYIMPGYYVENNMRILYLSINYNDYWIPVSFDL